MGCFVPSCVAVAAGSRLGDYVVRASRAAVLVGAAACALWAALPAAPAAEAQPLALVVMDPLAAPLSCPCVEGYAQRDYEQLAAFLEQRLGRKVTLAFNESLALALARQTGGRVDLVIGKQSVIENDAAKLRLGLTPVARLTDKQGHTHQQGLFVVPAADAAQSLADLKGYTILFGSEESAEKHAAALAALKQAALPVPEEKEIRESCSEGALEILEREFAGGAAAVISSYASPLLEGCGTIDPGSLRVVGRTQPVPFITAFVADGVGEAQRQAIVEALLAVGSRAELLVALESQSGFTALDEKAAAPQPGAAAPARGDDEQAADWPQFRGPGRDGRAAWLPDRLPAQPRVLFRAEMSAPALAGVAAAKDLVVVADRSLDDARDIFRGLDARSGAEKWKLDYPALGRLDYGNSPRATPLIYEGCVYTLGAFGDLHCLRLATGEVLWRRNLVGDFGGKPPTWGVCSSPLVVDGKLIVNPGAEDASVVALDPKTGEVLWRTPGRQAAYASFVVAHLGGVRQLVSYDATTLGGWDVATGRRLWTLVPRYDGDFNVPTPLPFDGKLLVATENNGTRLYAFDAAGEILAEPLAQNDDLAPDTASLVVAGGLVYGCWAGEMYCLDPADGLKPRWVGKDHAFEDYVSLLATDDRVLVVSTDGELLLVRAGGERYEPLGRAAVLDGGETLSYPALVGRRLYLRGPQELLCLDLGEE